MAISGVVDFLSPTEIRGWAFNEEAPDEHLAIEVALASAPIGQSVANIPREDLAPAGFGAGDHAFEVALERPITNETWRSLVVVAISENGGAAELAMDPELSLRGVDAAPASERETPLPPIGFPRDFIDHAAIAARLDGTGLSLSEVADAMLLDVWPLPYLDKSERQDGASALDHWMSGYCDFRRLSALAAEHDVKEGQLLDFGGATGRVFRHFAQQTSQWRVWSCDVRRSSFEFNLAHFPNSLRVFLSSTFPSLPIPDSAFDLILACSVFPHIDDAESAWLLELRRVLKIGGLALISTQNDETWRRMSPRSWQTLERFRPDLAAALELPEERLVVRLDSGGDRQSPGVFHADAYVLRNWSRYFEIAAIEAMALGEEAVVVCRRGD